MAGTRPKAGTGGKVPRLICGASKGSSPGATRQSASMPGLQQMVRKM